MSLIPDITELVARARADMRMGVPVILSDGQSGILAIPSETLDEIRLGDLQRLGRPVVVITSRRASTLKARAYDGQIARLSLPENANLSWVRAIADPADDLRVPMKGPLISQRDGDATLYSLAIILAKTAQLLPSVVAVAIENPNDMAQEFGLTRIDANSAHANFVSNSPLNVVAHARLPMAAAERGKLHIFRPEDGGEEHYAIEIGKPDRATPVLARLHSACFTGDVLGSLKCDCGPQLHAALNQMGAAGSGVLLYMNQEGRGIGLANKMRAYSLQDQGFDTVEANHRLGFEDDERDFRLGAGILRRLGFSSVRLMTNNPAKIAMMEKSGISVSERVPLKVGENRHNTGYLSTKAAKSGHML